MKKALLTLALVTICGLPGEAAGGNGYVFATASYYQPQPGDAVLVVQRSYRPGLLPSAEAAFRRNMPRLWKADKRFRDTIIMVNEQEHTSLTLAVCVAGDAGDAHLQAPVTEALKHALAGEPEVRNYRLLINNDENGYTPRDGDQVAVWRRRFSAENYEKALKFYREDLYPHLAADDRVRDSLLVADDQAREIVGFMFHRGAFSVSPGAAEKNAVLDGLSLNKAGKPMIYRIILVNNE